MTKEYRVKVLGLTMDRCIDLKIPFVIRGINGITREELPQTEEGLRRVAGNYPGMCMFGDEAPAIYVQATERYLGLAKLKPGHEFLRLLEGMKKVLSQIRTQEHERAERDVLSQQKWIRLERDAERARNQPLWIDPEYGPVWPGQSLSLAEVCKNY
jgi:hypothetical protein